MFPGGGFLPKGSAASVVMTLLILFLAAGYIRQNFKAREKAV